jgi:hypothetical protein
MVDGLCPRRASTSSPRLCPTYLSKPRKQRQTPLPTLFRPPAVSFPKRRRAVLAEIDCPNKLLPSPTEELFLPLPTRRRLIATPNMVHQSRSPPRRRNPGRNKTCVIENAVDMDATPRQPCRNSRKPAQALRETPMLKLTSSTSENKTET